jgi:DNA-binding transcriptional LysR family regulator
MRQVPSFFALRAFEAAARLNSFTAACDELHLTPSAISHQVRALEDYFGRPLFLRRNRGIDLTPDGERLLAGLTGAFDTIEAACLELLPAARRRSLVIHCAPSFASKWLGPRLKDFMNLHPAVNMRLLADANQIDLLRSEEVDVAIFFGHAEERRGIVVEPLGEEEIGAFCTPSVAAEYDPADPSSLGGLTLIESSVSPVRWPDWFAANGIPPLPPRGRPSFDRGALAISAAVQGLGVALESRRFALDELAKGELVELGGGTLHGLRREMHFLLYRSAKKGGAVASFRNWLMERIGTEEAPAGATAGRG